MSFLKKEKNINKQKNLNKHLPDSGILMHGQQGHMNHKVHCSVRGLAASVRILLPRKSLIISRFLKLDIQ